MVTPSLTATVVCAATLALLAAGMNPYLHNARSDHCFPLDTPHSVICFPTRCTHLFINATHPQGADLLDPVPRAGDPAQVYGAFKCNVTTWYEYGKAIPQRGASARCARAALGTPAARATRPSTTAVTATCARSCDVRRIDGIKQHVHQPASATTTF
eukprot:CAMPEP_0174851156 /NCGR_PEP_ID=MMETSP1114-20130205/22010_1 /TAXON_ID=312471 /ORGANISM="Neobodo designis, Strain CCAP 1951/1" /LENGTH=156 /DNA_ID=CAMNT_0016085673 /DNA_START=34 /DNA_END=505 /DNA_ORIENTATION=+